MKKDLLISLSVAVIGVIVAYFVTGIFLTPLESVSYTTVDASKLSAELATPDDKVFNYLAINPTVEVYVGNCDKVDADGNCVVSSDRRAELLRQAQEQYREKIGYYDFYGYFHKYEIEDDGFDDYYGNHFTIVDGGYVDEDGKFYSFESDENGFYDGAEYRIDNNNEDEEEEEEDEIDEEMREPDYKNYSRKKTSSEEE